MKELFKKSISLERKQSRVGYIFVLPIILGLAFIYVPVLIQSFIYSLSRITMELKGISLEMVGFEHYHRALFIDPHFRRQLIDSITRMMVDVPVIIIFAFFMANVLNQKFRGRLAARIILFLPVIIATGIISEIESWDMMQAIYRSGGKLDVGGSAVNVFNYNELRQMIMFSIPNKTLVNIVLGSIDGLYSVITHSGVQILIFLAGLQSIPESMYEAARVEGATSWEMFWKMSFPIISPLILVNVIYTIIDSFFSYRNNVISIIRSVMNAADQYAYASALAWLYLGVVAIVLAAIWLVVSRLIIYQD